MYGKTPITRSVHEQQQRPAASAQPQRKNSNPIKYASTYTGGSMTTSKSKKRQRNFDTTTFLSKLNNRKSSSKVENMNKRRRDHSPPLSPTSIHRQNHSPIENDENKTEFFLNIQEELSSPTATEAKPTMNRLSPPIYDVDSHTTTTTASDCSVIIDDKEPKKTEKVPRKEKFKNDWQTLHTSNSHKSPKPIKFTKVNGVLFFHITLMIFKHLFFPVNHEYILLQS